MPLTIKQVANDLLSKLGIEGSDPSAAPALAQQDVVVAYNGAMQMLQTAGQDFFTRETISQNFGAGTASFTVARAAQAILGPIRLSGTTPLKALLSRGEYDQFDRIFLGEATYGAALGVPIAYFVENLRDGSTGDINKINIYLAPKPSAGGSVSIDLVMDAPNIAVANLVDTTEVPVAQAYTESVFLPLARYLIMLSSQFSRPELRPQIQSDYQVAMVTLGYQGGFPNAQQPGPGRKVEG